MSQDARPRLNRNSLIESLEDRVVMSADPLGGLLGGSIAHHSIDETPVNTSPPLAHHDFTEPTVGQSPDFWLDPNDDLSYSDQLYEIEQSLASAHDSSGLTTARANYGFRGGGQTVAVIDSGIAWDHYALGNGFGSSYRVVGGWDFTEGDADPYDDGTAGSHGTHVAGIVGASGNGAAQQGVAPDVDLVGLRVFDDAGNGYFSWVEQALNWVHANRNAFENPITAVNLSLGTNWNSSTVPSWAMLEDEFAQLKADGIFISVSAGNSFTSYNQPGLSYPAASSHVVPVMSADDSGSLSYFSQRLGRAIAAPGRYIQSTVPDYNGNNNNVTDDWGYKSGTSMAAPYVAGASVLIREAMEFVGYTNITQDTIYDHMMATADTFFDSATGQNYIRLNVSAALDALMPVDDYGSSMGAAYNLGTINPGTSPSTLSNLNGVISQLSDVDYFTFTAGATGTVTFAATNTTHHLDANWQGFGGEGWSDASGDSYTMNVVAGQQYTVSLSTGDGLGYYDFSVTAESSFTYTDWGVLAGQAISDVTSSGGPTWYRIVAGQSGYVSADLLNATGTINVDLYDSSRVLIDTGSNTRVDLQANQGDEFFLRIDGVGAANLAATNLVSLSGATVNIGGTAGDDVVSFTAGDSTHTVSINGVVYNFASSSYNTFEVASSAGRDVVSMTGTDRSDTATLRHNTATLASSNYSVTAIQAEQVFAYGGGGFDRAVFYDSAGNDRYIGRSNRASLHGVGFRNDAFGFDRTIAYSSSGADRAIFYDSVGNDTFYAEKERALMYGSGFRNDTFGFTRSVAYASYGFDRALLHDSAGADVYVGWHNRAALYGAGYRNDAHNFDRTFTYSTSGADRAVFFDSVGDDVFTGRSNRATFQGSGFFNDTYNFSRTVAYSRSGSDVAVFYDSIGNDNYIAWSNRALMYGVGFRNDALGFSRSVAYASHGNDRAFFYDTAGNDTYVGRDDRVILYGDGYFNDARNFEQTHATASGGNDIAYLHDSDSDDTLTGGGENLTLQGSGYRNSVTSFEGVTAISRSGGSDTSNVSAIDYALEHVGDWS